MTGLRICVRRQWRIDARLPRLSFPIKSKVAALLRLSVRGAIR